ncbi:MAG: hypothetical protein R3C99_20105 [Pirellulaceae bacterium]
MFSRETRLHAGQTLFSAKRRQPLRKRSNRRRTRARLEQLERRDLLAVTFQFNFANDGNFGFNDP